MLTYLGGEGEARFLGLTPAGQRREIYRISKDDPYILTNRLKQLYEAYTAQPGEDRTGAFGKYVRAFQAFGAYYHGFHTDPDFSATFPEVHEKFTLSLPSLVMIWSFEYNKTPPETAGKNTKLQEELGKEIGILLPDETLFDFRNRGEIRLARDG